MTTIDISIDELAAARAVILAAHPEESDADHGVALAVSGGTRRWTAWSGEAIASTAEFPAGLAPDGGALVSRRAVEFAAILAERHDLDRVEFTFSGIGVTVAAGPVAVHVEQPEPRAVPAPIYPFVGEGARARVAGPALFDLLAMGRIVPAGVDLDESDEPQFHLLVGSGNVTGLVDWPATGIGPTQFQVSGSTTGDGVAVISPALAARVVGTERPCEMTITVPATGESWVEIAGSRWTARIWADEVEANDDDDLESGDRRRRGRRAADPSVHRVVPRARKPATRPARRSLDRRRAGVRHRPRRRVADRRSPEPGQLGRSGPTDPRRRSRRARGARPARRHRSVRGGLRDHHRGSARGGPPRARRTEPAFGAARPPRRDADETTRALATDRLRARGQVVPALEPA